MIHRFLRRRSDDSHSETIWLTVYSDLITNLALVFLAMYGIVTMGNEAIKQAVESMKMENIELKTDGSKVLTLEDVGRLLRQEFKNTPDITVVDEAGAVRILLGESVLFTSGGAELKPSAEPLLEKAFNLLSLLPYTIVVEGHTDDRPIRAGLPYRNNWELSLARAMSVVDVLSKKLGLPANQIAAAAYGENRPRASNLTPASRRLNRRVEIALFKDFPHAL